MAWRYCLPLRFESGGGHAPVEAPEREIEAFFEAAPLQASELLETETRLVVDWLKNRTGKLLKAWREPTETDISADDAEGFGLLRPLRQDAPVAFLLDSGGKPEEGLGLKNLRAQDLRRRLVGRTLVMDARFGGIENGLLDDGHDVPASTIENNWGDPGAPREEQPTIRVRPVRGGDPAEREEPWRETFKIPYLISPEGDAEIWLVVEKRADAVIDEESRAMVSKPQLIDEHQAWVADEAMRIAKEIGLSDGDEAMLAAAAHHHDDGKAALRLATCLQCPLGKRSPCQDRRSLQSPHPERLPARVRIGARRATRRLRRDRALRPTLRAGAASDRGASRQRSPGHWDRGLRRPAADCGGARGA